MLLSVYIVVSLGRQLVSWSIIEVAEVDFQRFLKELKVVNLNVFHSQRN